MMIKRITFDTNVLGAALKSGHFLYESIKSGKYEVFAAEVVITMDGLRVPDKLKLACLKNVDPVFSYKTWKMRTDAGLKFLLCPRVGMSRPKLVEDNKAEDKKYVPHERQKRYFEILSFIENELHAGRKRLVEAAIPYGASHEAKPGDPEYFAAVLESNIDRIKSKDIERLFSDWSDADSIAAHYGYGNDFFCTNDIGKGGGHKSVLHEGNRKLLTNKYGILFKSIEEIKILE